MNYQELVKKICDSHCCYSDFGIVDSTGKLFACIRHVYPTKGPSVYLFGEALLRDGELCQIDPLIESTLEDAVAHAIWNFTGKEKFNKYHNESLFEYELIDNSNYYAISVLPKSDKSDGQKHIQDNDFIKSLFNILETKDSDVICECGAKMVSELRRNSDASWASLAGREAWVDHCPKCGLLGPFNMVAMS